MKGRPRNHGERTVSRSVNLPLSLATEIDELAQRSGVTTADVLRDLLRRGLAAQQADEVAA